MNNSHILLETHGALCYQILTPKYLDGACEVIANNLFTRTRPNDPESLKELDLLPRITAKDGVTLIAVDKNKDTVAGVAFNKISLKNQSYFENFAPLFKNSRAQKILDFILSIHNICDVFEHCQVNCTLEIVFLATASEYRKQGIGNKLIEHSVNVAQQLVNGINIKQSIDGTELTLEPAPEAVFGIFTSPISQKIALNLGFSVAADCENEDTSSTMVAYKMLNKTQE